MNHYFFVGATVGALFLVTALSSAQEAREFEFASVRSSPPVSSAPAAATSGTRAGLLALPGGRFEARGQALANLARVAFGFDQSDPNRGVVQAADWMWNDRFDITASAGRPWTKPTSGTTVPLELRTMLRALLEERFALQARIVTKNQSVTALRLAKPEQLGPGLRPSVAKCRGPFTETSLTEVPPRPLCPFTNTNISIQAEAVTMTEVALIFSQHAWFRGQSPLIDQTKLPGLYDVSFAGVRGGPWPAVLQAALKAQLGLKLEETRVPLPALIIERAQKPRED